jgi:Putative Ig domain
MVGNVERKACFDVKSGDFVLIVHVPKGTFMTQISFDATFNVSGGGGTPLTVTPATGDFELVVGSPVDGTPVGVVTGGQAPYTYALDPSSDPMPAGVSFAEDGNGNITLAGTPTAATTQALNVVLDITDSAGNQASLKAKARTI